MQRKKVLKCRDGFQASTGTQPDDDLAHVLFEDDDGYCLSVSRFPDDADLVEVMVYDQVALKTGDVEVELSPDRFRLTLSEAAAAELDGTTEYVVPLSATAEQLAQIDEALNVIFDGKHGGCYVRRL
ncbi:MAG: hypothetical protein ACJ76Y_15690 [Thermoanaerobaculia bacterium]